MIPIFVGLDHREPVAYTVFCHSVATRTKAQVSFHPVSGEQRDGSNSFIYERFCVAHKLGFKGWAIWADGDMLCRGDIEELWNLRDPKYDVMVVQHDYTTKHPVKYLGQKNEDYPRKNWSSLMLINAGNYPWRKVTPLYVSEHTGRHLHRFEFLKDERIGELPKEWNWLVSEYPNNPEAKLAHFTVGLPCFYPSCDYSAEWFNELRAATSHEHWDETKLVSER